jgi:hypothetical protein
MFLALADVQRIAAEVVAEQNPALEVAVTSADGDAGYTELILTLRGCSVEPCRTLIGIDRDMSEPQFRLAVEEHLRQHLDDHRDGRATIRS